MVWWLVDSVALLLLSGILGLWANDQMASENMFLVFDVYRHRYGTAEKFEMMIGSLAIAEALAVGSTSSSNLPLFCR